MKTTLNILLLFSLFQSSAQNLVPNPSFEDYNLCPDYVSQLYRLLNWYRPTLGSTDFYHSCNAGTFVGVPINCNGNQSAVTGNGYIGVLTSYEFGPLPVREYAQIKLNSTLANGTKYFISLHVSLSDSSNLATDDFGIYISNDSVLNYTSSQNLSVSPQIENTQGNYLSDPTIWYNISGEYIAFGGERFITIGNFKDDLNTSTTLVYSGSSIPSNYFGYYYIDDVCVSSDSLECISFVGINETYISNKKELIRISDTLGRETKDTTNTVLFYIYSDGTIEKVFRVE